ncbi:MAG: DUF512 domain-containing protein [Sumerlaeia bacterium]
MSKPSKKATDYRILPAMTPEIRRRVLRADRNDTVSSGLSVAAAPTGVEVEWIDSEGLGAQSGLQLGDKIHSINGEPIRDTVDYFFYSAEEFLELSVTGTDGTTRLIEVEKELPEDQLGVELKQFTTQNCGCNCVFCFVHQLPDNMRKSLYIKDEDYRLSFMQGSYITGITLKQEDLDRIARQRLSPLYISVHAVNEDLRRWLLGVKKAPAILEVLTFFKKHRIQVHTQIVLCPGHNDGEELDKTLDALLGLMPTVQSVAIVPLGMTKWRDGLPDMEPVTPDYARRFVKRLKPRLKQVIEKYGEPLVMLADEWYLIGGMKAPAYSQFPEVPQLENGVGMVYHFYSDFAEARRVLSENPTQKPWRVAAMTSTLSHVVLERIRVACQEFAGISVTPVQVVNSVFGETIHVTGLLTGQDLLAAIQANPGYDQYLLPGNCLRKYDERFLDDMTLTELRDKAGVLITPVLGGSLDFAETILEQATNYRHDAPKLHPFLAPHWSNS